MNTKGIRTSIQKRNVLLRRSKRAKTDDSVQEHKKYDKILHRVKNASFQNYITSEISENIDDKRKIWKTFDKISKQKRSKKPDIKQLVNSDGKILSDPGDIVNNLNNHFNTIGKKLFDDIKGTTGDPLDYITKNPTQSIFLNPTICEEIIKLINQIDIKKASGPDEITGYLIKITKNVISPILVDLFNICLRIGVFPDCLKTAEIIPLHKGGKKEVNTNYRPISLLPQFGKLFEKIISKRMTSFFEKHELLVQNQYGFRKTFSTELAVTEVYNKLLHNFEEKKHTCAIFLDLKKAFDTVSHDILIRKLQKFGIRGVALSLLTSYLTGRLHYVKMSHTKSDVRTLRFGVPQGSVLGPLLFLIFINDLPNCTKFAVTLFADDTFLSMESHNFARLQMDVNQELKKVHDWLIANKLTLNVIKSKFMLLSNKRNICKDNFKVKLNGSKLERCSSYKYLGVYFDDKLDWKTHVNYVCEKIGKVCGFLSKLRYCANKEVLKMVYFALVQSHIQYCNIVWGTAPQTSLAPLVAIQNRVVRILNFAPFLSRNVQQFYDDFGVMNLEQIHKFATGKFMYKLASHQLPCNFDDVLADITIETALNLRSTSNGDLKVNFARTKYGEKMIQTDGVKLWNRIPTNIKQSESFEIFVKRLKKYILPGTGDEQDQSVI